MKIPIRDFDPIKDLPNPTFKVKIKSVECEVHLSNLRNVFRKYLNTIGSDWLKGQTNMSTVHGFLTIKNIELNKSDQKKLVIAFTVDITRKKLGFPFGQLTGDLLKKWNEYKSNK